jgi:hypothetical protein
MARGSVTRRSDGWCIRLDVGVDPETGKRRQVSRQGFRTKREAQAVLNDLLLERGTIPSASVLCSGPVGRRLLANVVCARSGAGSLSHGCSDTTGRPSQRSIVWNVGR